MLGQDPLHAVLHVEAQQEEVVAVARHELHGIQTGGDGVDARHHLDVAAVDVGGGQAAGADGAEAEARTEGVDVPAMAEGLVQRQTARAPEGRGGEGIGRAVDRPPIGSGSGRQLDAPLRRRCC